MEDFTWKEKFSVHVDEMDRQHKRLLKYFAEFQDEIIAGEASQKAFVLLDEVADFFEFHFSEEERLMKTMNYPELDLQTSLHAIFMDELKEIINPFRMGNVSGKRVVALFRDWYINHMIFEDHKYGVMISGGKPLA